MLSIALMQEQHLAQKASALCCLQLTILAGLLSCKHGLIYCHLYNAESATADVVVRLRADPGAVSPAELRVAIIGNVDSGKSTMVSRFAV